MKEIVNTQQKRLYDSLATLTDEQTALQVALADMLPKAPSDKRKAQWAKQICETLTDRLPEETAKAVRMACHCKPPLAKFERLRRQFAKDGDLDAYVHAQNEAGTGADFWLEDGYVYMSYPRCYCSFVKNATEPIPESWCWCTIGYAKELHDFVFGRETKVELLKSVLRGDEKCVMRISLL